MKKSLENLYEIIENMEYTASAEALKSIMDYAEQIDVKKSYGEWVITAKELVWWRNAVAEIITDEISAQAGETVDKADVAEILRIDTDWLLPADYEEIYFDSDKLLEAIGYGYEQEDVDDFRPCRYDD